ncbi:MAG: cobalt ECF transporter T component CbiQ [Candidatus Methanomethyliales bacterium]|nr:cobalt ECF transporter T component CbiQ [Candidatus Methanomethylicales archaeon]
MSSAIKDLVRGLEEILEADGAIAPRRSLSPMALVIIASLIVLSALFANSLLPLLALGILNTLLAASLGIRLKRYFIKPLIFSLFVLVISLPAAFLTGGTPLFTISMGSFTVSPSFEGAYRVAQFVLRVWVCVATLTTLTSILGIDGILSVLAQIRAPRILVEMISLTYRYLFISLHETQKMLLARDARRFRNKKYINAQDLRDLGKVLAALFIRTYERSERVYLAMKARGFTLGRTRTLKKYSINSNDLPVILAVLAAIFFALVTFA